MFKNTKKDFKKMNFEFGINKNYEIPLITLCNPDRTEIASVSNFKSLHIIGTVSSNLCNKYRSFEMSTNFLIIFLDNPELLYFL